VSFADRLAAAVDRVENPALLGIDPHLDLLPDEFAVARDKDAPRAERADAVARFGEALVDVAAGRVAAVKPQSAFFEVLGADGLQAWERVVRAARAADLIVLGDVKRGDIASTAAAYATAFLDGPGRGDTRCDALTVQPYQGIDSVRPFLNRCPDNDAGVFVLVRTSNPSADDFQTKGAPKLYTIVADAVAEWGREHVGESGWSDVGAVVGATRPEELAMLRARMPQTPFLVPGFGAQGGTARDVVGAFPDARHPWRGGLVNSSRGIAFAYRNDAHAGRDWRDAARDALDAMVVELREALDPTER
jgi:orotidine-5'-phosphate decarboxylase